MKLISWNVNGLRACLKRNPGFIQAFQSLDADIICLQETKMIKGQAELDLTGYEEYWNSAVKKGYSGTAIFTRVRPLSVSYGMGEEAHDQEGRIIRLEFEDYYLVNVYVPNSRRAQIPGTKQYELVRLPYRMIWEDAFRAYVAQLDRIKPVIICGDMNVAHEEIDIKNAKSNRKNAGFTDEERGKMSALLQSGFTDIYRKRNPDKHDAYTWWSMMPGVRERNIGWRIDYFILSGRLESSVKDAMIYPEIYGSDHCPVGLML